jgi:DNA-3-methyladenine glycosylase
VLVRAAEPLPGSGLAPGACRGPGRLCRALGIDTRLSGRHLFEPRARLTLREGPRPARIGRAPRVGIRKAAQKRLRFFDAESRAVSAPRPLV